MKNLIRFSAALFLMAPTFAIASDADTVIGMATKCWNIPEDTDYSRASATFEVSYNSEGELTQILTVEFQPVRKAGEIFAISAQDAIVTCASKTSVRSRSVRVVMRYTEQKSDGPLIMKRPLR